jgi:hypothetical protein
VENFFTWATPLPVITVTLNNCETEDLLAPSIFIPIPSSLLKMGSNNGIMEFCLWNITGKGGG